MNDELIRLYLDNCCLNRPFDDQSQERVRLEAEAIVSIMNNVTAGQWRAIGSQVIDVEISQIKDSYRKEKILFLLRRVHEVVRFDPTVLDRAFDLQNLGLKRLDALHIACAEKGSADVFLTTDDQLLRVAKRNQNRLRVRVENPLTWLKEVEEE